MRDFLQRPSCVYTSSRGLSRLQKTMWSQIAPWPENIDLILSDYQKEMIETDSYLYTANNDRDYAGSDEHNSKSIILYLFWWNSEENTRLSEIFYLSLPHQSKFIKLISE